MLAFLNVSRIIWSSIWNQKSCNINAEYGYQSLILFHSFLFYISVFRTLYLDFGSQRLSLVYILYLCTVYIWTILYLIYCWHVFYVDLSWNKSGTTNLVSTSVESKFVASKDVIWRNIEVKWNKEFSLFISPSLPPYICRPVCLFLSFALSHQLWVIL